ncbi:hypothetical protein GGX14DRAFT_640497 [Mycena pura]|uniref:DNA-binding protein RAP1 n=1 Tax=Mycena pura TaxID=153505 RepID=A0AAD7E3P9_9AGAR|nr:hypothetical protein GGX14DRAFT_640497 [Mycena pura]
MRSHVVPCSFVRNPNPMDSNGLAVKFFIQKDLPENVQAELCETITSLGGRVEAKVPRQGYILVQPATTEEERLRLCWTSVERPERFFVPYTYVEACKIAGMLLKQIFVENGAPIPMHIHSSIANINARNALSQRIMHSGGDPHASLQSARVILADPNTEVFPHLVKVYQGVADKYIESYLWVKKCVERGIVAYTPMIYKNPGGRRPGEERTQFIEEDEHHLANYIATKIPYKETGGRTGNRLYQQLCELGSDPEYAWVTRHTWQSWRERYKKNAARLDVMISAIVEQTKPAQGEKGQYGYVRQAEKQKRPRRKKKNQDPSYVEDEVIVEDGEDLGLFSGVDPMGELGDPAGMPGMMFPNTEAGPSMTSRSPAEEEMDEEGSEWEVRVGTSPPPIWAGGKRKTNDGQEAGPSKRAKANEPVAPQQSPGHIHVVDQGIRDIAAEFKFTVEEVQAYYDQCGEMEITRNRFKDMRELLTTTFAITA